VKREKKDLIEKVKKKKKKRKFIIGIVFISIIAMMMCLLNITIKKLFFNFKYG
jgi:accessory gene regulator protein AgrB